MTANYLEKEEIINFYNTNAFLPRGERADIAHRIITALREAFKVALIEWFPRGEESPEPTDAKKEIPDLCLEASHLVDEENFPCIRIPTKSFGFFEIEIKELCVPYENIGHGKIDWAISCLDEQLATLMDEMGDILDKSQSIRERWQDLQNKRKDEIE